MVRIIIVIYSITICFLSCRSLDNSNQDKLLSDEEWKNILEYTLMISSINEGDILRQYGNIEMRDVLKYAYLNRAEILGYEINDSIINNILTRKDKIIQNNLDTIFDLNFIDDTNNIKNDFLIYSEPFFVDNNNILCLSVIRKSNNEDNINQWVFFFKNEKGSFKLIQFYDSNKGIFYGPAQN